MRIRKPKTEEQKERRRELDRLWNSDPERAEKRLKSARKRQRDKYADRKQTIFELLGNSCARCGFDDPRALQVDHINGGGVQERKRFNNNLAKYYQHIIEKGSAEYQILCANCNWIKRFEEEECNLAEKRMARLLRKGDY